jgi:hypothetical protein
MKNITYKMKNITYISICAILLTSCASYNNNLMDPNSSIEFDKNDFEVSEQLSAKSSSTRILGIDWENLFKNNKSGEITPQRSAMNSVSSASIPVVGGLTTSITSGLTSSIFGLFFDNTEEIATHKLISNNSENDVVLYPRYETKTSKPILGIGLIYKKTEVKVTAKLGKLKK